MPEVPCSIRILWPGRPALALHAEQVRRLIDYCGPKLLQAFAELHAFNDIEHLRLGLGRANEAEAWRRGARMIAPPASEKVFGDNDAV